MPLALSATSIFEIRSSLYVQITWAKFLLFILPLVAGMTGAGHHAQPLVETGSHEFFAWAGLKLPSFQFPPPKMLGLQAWTTVPSYVLYFKIFKWSNIMMMMLSTYQSQL
jgi:hypothetical protein